MAYKIVSISPTFGYYVKDPVVLLEQKGCRVELFSKEKKGNLRKYLEDVDAIIVGFEKIGREIISASPRLKVIAKHGAGFDNIDINLASERGVL